MFAPDGNSDRISVFPRISLFPETNRGKHWDSRRNKTNYLPKEQTLSVLLYNNKLRKINDIHYRDSSRNTVICKWVNRIYSNDFNSISGCLLCILLLLFYFYLFLHKHTWKIVVYKLASCPAICFIFMYVAGRGGRGQQLLTCCAARYNIRFIKIHMTTNQPITFGVHPRSI
jgi:hypothetical protein